LEFRYVEEMDRDDDTTKYETTEENHNRPTYNPSADIPDVVDTTPEKIIAPRDQPSQKPVLTPQGREDQQAAKTRAHPKADAKPRAHPKAAGKPGAKAKAKGKVTGWKHFENTSSASSEAIGSLPRE
jgi:hypothetical protein